MYLYFHQEAGAWSSRQNWIPHWCYLNVSCRDLGSSPIAIVGKLNRKNSKSWRIGDEGKRPTTVDLHCQVIPSLLCLWNLRLSRLFFHAKKKKRLGLIEKNGLALPTVRCCRWRRPKSRWKESSWFHQKSWSKLGQDFQRRNGGEVHPNPWNRWNLLGQTGGEMGGKRTPGRRFKNNCLLKYAGFLFGISSWQILSGFSMLFQRHESSADAAATASKIGRQDPSASGRIGQSKWLRPTCGPKEQFTKARERHHEDGAEQSFGCPLYRFWQIYPVHGNQHIQNHGTYKILFQQSEVSQAQCVTRCDSELYDPAKLPTKEKSNLRREPCCIWQRTSDREPGAPWILKVCGVQRYGEFKRDENTWKHV